MKTKTKHKTNNNRETTTTEKQQQQQRNNNNRKTTTTEKQQQQRNNSNNNNINITVGILGRTATLPIKKYPHYNIRKSFMTANSDFENDYAEFDSISVDSLED